MTETIYNPTVPRLWQRRQLTDKVRDAETHLSELLIFSGGAPHYFYLPPTL